MYNIVKGDGKIKKVTLKFNGLGYNDRYQALVMIYDIDGNLIFVGNTYNGVVCLLLRVNCGYRVVARFFSEIIDTYFYNDKCNYVFTFEHATINDVRTINFLLTDQNYIGLALERGELTLWQKQ